MKSLFSVLFFSLIVNFTSAQSFDARETFNKLLDSIENVTHSSLLQSGRTSFVEDTVSGLEFISLIKEQELFSSCSHSNRFKEIETSLFSYNEYQLLHKSIYEIRIISIIQDSTNKNVESYLPVPGLKVIAYFDSSRIMSYTNHEGIINYFGERPEKFELHFLPRYPVRIFAVEEFLIKNDSPNTLIISYPNNELLSNLRSNEALILSRQIESAMLIREMELLKIELEQKLNRENIFKNR